MSPGSPQGRLHVPLVCAQLRALIPLGVAGDEALGCEPAIASHLRGCPSCAAQAGDHADQRDLLRAYGRVGGAVKLDLWGALRARLLRLPRGQPWLRDRTSG